MNFTIRRKHDKIYVVNFDTQYNLCMSFVRIQEYYESPEFKGKKFSLEEYMDWWAVNYGKGAFDYPALWNGFNIPGKVIKAWVNENWFFLRPKEKELLNALQAKLAKKKKEFYRIEDPNIELRTEEDYYLIGAHKDDVEKKEVMDHETAHAFYTLYPSYKKSCQRVLKKYSETNGDRLKEVKETLFKMGYHDDVIDDEVQAYLSTTQRSDKYPCLVKEKVFVDNLKKFKDKLK